MPAKIGKGKPRNSDAFTAPVITLSPGFSIIEDDAQGTVVGTYSTDAGVSGSWAIDNSDFQLSAFTGVTVELQRSGTGTLTAGVAETVICTCTIAGRPVATLTVSISVAATPNTEAEDFVQAFVVENWNSATSAGFYRGCLLFADGDIASTEVPVIRDTADNLIGAQFDQVSYWPSGAMRLCVFSMRDTSFSSLESRTYNVTVKTGTLDNTGAKSLTDITGSDTLEVALSSFTQYNGSTTVQRGAGAALNSFTTACATTTRVTKIASGSVREAWQVWAPFKDAADGSGTADAHLNGVWYVDIWKNADGTIADIEYGCVLEQVWWSVASKFRLNYTAVLKKNGSTINTYSSIQHPYRSQWITCRTDADNGHAKRYWKTSMPTLFYKPDKAYWVSTGLIPRFDTGFTPSSNSTLGYNANYTPCGGINHRVGIDGAGGYAGRGMITNMDAVAFMRQTAADYKSARVNALAGLHIPYHYRSNNTRTRPTESADTAHTVISLILDPQASANYTFTSVGMPAPVNAYIGASPITDGYVAPLGGTGVWSISIDSSHAVNYSAFWYLMEGERYLLEATLDLACNCEHQTNGNTFAGRNPLEYYDYTVYQTTFSIPSTPWGGVGQMRTGTNPRKAGFALAMKSFAAFMIPDDDVQCGYIRANLDQQLNYCVSSLPYMPQSQKDAGFWRDFNAPTYDTSWSIWMHAIIGMGFWQAYRSTKNANALTMATMLSNVAIGAFSGDLYYSNTFHGQPCLKSKVWNASTNDYFARGIWLWGPYDCTVDTTTNVLTLGTDPSWVNFVVTDNDVFYSTSMQNNGQVYGPGPPSELTIGTPYYAVNASGRSFKLSASMGGSAIDFTTAGPYYLACRLADFNHAVAAATPSTIQPDSYAMMQRALLLEASNAGIAEATSLVATADAFLASVNHSTWVTWKYMSV